MGNLNFEINNILSEISTEQWLSFCAELDKEIVKKSKFDDCTLKFEGVKVFNNQLELKFKLLRDCEIMGYEALVFDAFNCTSSNLFGNDAKKISYVWRKFLLSKFENYAAMLKSYKALRLKQLEEENKKRLQDELDEFSGLIN